MVHIHHHHRKVQVRCRRLLKCRLLGKYLYATYLELVARLR